MLYKHSITNPRLCSSKVLCSRPKCPRSPSLIISGGGSPPRPTVPPFLLRRMLGRGTLQRGLRNTGPEHGTMKRRGERGWENSWGFLGFIPATPLWWVKAIGMHTHPREEVGEKNKWKGDKNRRFNCRPCLSSEITRACNTLDTADEEKRPTAQKENRQMMNKNDFST